MAVTNNMATNLNLNLNLNLPMVTTELMVLVKAMIRIRMELKQIPPLQQLEANLELLRLLGKMIPSIKLN
jgi:hypothetical protein